MISKVLFNSVTLYRGYIFKGYRVLLMHKFRK